MLFIFSTCWFHLPPLSSIHFFPQATDGAWIEDEEQTVKLKADFVISAFGSELGDKDGELPSLWFVGRSTRF